MFTNCTQSTLCLPFGRCKLRLNCGLCGHLRDLNGPSAAYHIILSTTFEPLGLLLHSTNSTMFTNFKNCKLSPVACRYPVIRLRSPFVDCFSFVRGVRFPNIARDLRIFHTVRIFRGVDYLNTPQPLYFVQILQFVHVLHGLELVSGANFPDGFRFLHRSNRLECFGSLHSLRCFHCARSSRSPRSLHCHRSLHHPRSPPGVDCANFVPAAA